MRRAAVSTPTMIVNDLSNIAQQAFMLILMRSIIIIGDFTHDLFFKREMGNDIGIDFAQEKNHAIAFWITTQLVVKVVQQLQHLPMLNIHRQDSGFKTRVPIYQGHQCHFEFLRTPF